MAASSQRTQFHLSLCSADPPSEICLRDAFRGRETLSVFASGIRVGVADFRVTEFDEAFDPYQTYLQVNLAGSQSLIPLNDAGASTSTVDVLSGELPPGEARDWGYQVVTVALRVFRSGYRVTSTLSAATSGSYLLMGQSTLNVVAAAAPIDQLLYRSFLRSGGGDGGALLPARPALPPTAAIQSLRISCGKYVCDVAFDQTADPEAAVDADLVLDRVYDLVEANCQTRSSVTPFGFEHLGSPIATPPGDPLALVREEYVRLNRANLFVLPSSYVSASVLLDIGEAIASVVAS